MFDLTTITILSLIVPTIVAPLACLVFVRAIARAEAARHAARKAVPAVPKVPAPRIVLESPAAPLTVERVPERNVA
jgi:hypothetical protein